MRNLLLFFMLVPFLGLSQNQTNWWFFGQNAGLDFTSGAPVPTNVGQLNTIEGCAAIADDCGQLLFYTDGTTIWNRNHVIMQNGTGLLGDASSTQSAVIIPLPENTDLYYVFTVDRFLSGPGGAGLNYSIVDMTLDGGLGAVDPASKNLNLLEESSEKIFAAKAANGVDIWIVAYNPTDQTTVRMDRFSSFLLTPNGLDLSATVNSPSPQVVIANGDGRGYLRASPDGTRVAMMTQGTVTTNPNESARGAWLFDFDIATGIIDNPLRLNFRSDYFVYGTEFSLDSNLLYVDSNQFQSGIQGPFGAGARELLQYNLQAPNFEDNPVVVFQSDPSTTAENSFRGALQLAPDEKIYYSRANSEWLSVINNPNGVGAACNFVFDGVQVANGTLVNEGLPPFLNGFFAPSYAILEGCAGQPSQFSIDEIGVCPGSSVVWDFGDPASGAANTSTDPNPVHTYNVAGTYNAVATISTPLNTYQAFRDIVIIDAPTITGVQDLFACDSDADGVEMIDFTSNITAAFGGQSPATYDVQIYPTLPDAENDTNRLPSQLVTGSDTFFIRIFGINSRGCELIQPFEVTVNQEPDITIGPEFECDEFNDGVELFDLDLIGLEALGTQDATLFTYSFHESRIEAESNTNQLPLVYQNNLPSETLFIRIELDANPVCFSVESFTINLQTEPEINGNLEIQLCDDVNRDDTEVFDLLTLESQIRATQPANFTIDFYPTQSDAESDTNSISSDFTNNTPQEIVWVRLTNNADIICFDVAPIQLEVFERPTVEITGNEFKCIGDSVDLTATTGFVSYEWSTLETTPQITVTDPGTYSVNITDSNGCNDTTEFTVTDFEPTQITDIQVQEFTLRDNSIIVSVSGSGPFEYSLDNFTYQESNTFTGLTPGFYTVYVRDLNGCDLVEQDTEIIYGPPFFTPNGDSFNDRWQVTAIETEPDARIFIFDRYGKLLIQLSPLSAGWDGTYLGNPMPSTDYWYLVELVDGKSFRGHFSLKR